MPPTDVLSDGTIRWAAHRKERRSGWATSSRQNLERFVRLPMTGGLARYRAFASRFGPMWICEEHDLPGCVRLGAHASLPMPGDAEPPCRPRGVAWELDERGVLVPPPFFDYEESTGGVRRWVAAFRAVTKIIGILDRGLICLDAGDPLADQAGRQRQPLPSGTPWSDLVAVQQSPTFLVRAPAEVGAAVLPGPLARVRPGSSEIDIEASIEAQRHAVAFVLDSWLKVANVRVTMTALPDRGSHRFELHPGADSLFGALVLELALQVHARNGFHVCDGCGAVYDRGGRRPKTGQDQFCPKCSGDISVRQRRYRQRKKLTVEN